MKLKLRTKVLSTVLFLSMASALIGSVTGSLAWYAYNVKATLVYKGTSITDAAQMEFGIVSYLKTEEDENHEVVTRYHQISGLSKPDSNHICWAAQGKGINGISINEYLEDNGYATNLLSPITSSSYEDGQELKLRSAPVAGGFAYNPNNIAPKTEYVRIPFAFRVANVGVSETSPDYYRKGAEVWITKVEALADADDNNSNVYKALRMHIDNGLTGAAGKFILNPTDLTATNADPHATKVAGLLDLNFDGYYDSQAGEEYLYGEYSGSGSKTVMQATSTFVDINGSGYTPGEGDNIKYVNTFLARHEKNINSYENYEGIEIAKQHYYGPQQFIPADDGTGILSGGKVVAKTNTDNAAIGYCTITIWLEGWDYSIIDTEINHDFNLGITFQINSVV